MFLFSVFLFIHSMYLPTSAIDWIETSADILECDEKAYCAGHNITHNLMSVICLNVLSQMHKNTVPFL